MIKIGDLLHIKEQFCVESDDRSFFNCFLLKGDAEGERTLIIKTIEKEPGCWGLVNSNDERWGKNGINHIAVNRARGHMGKPYAEDNFEKQYRRFHHALSEKGCSSESEVERFKNRNGNGLDKSLYSVSKEQQRAMAEIWDRAHR